MVIQIIQPGSKGGIGGPPPPIGGGGGVELMHESEYERS
jgi:hypothetical protein